MRLVEVMLIAALVAVAVGAASTIHGLQHAMARPAISPSTVFAPVLMTPLTVVGLVVGVVLVATLIGWSAWNARAERQRPNPGRHHRSPPRRHRQ
jgi:hypothetical protein